MLKRHLTKDLRPVVPLQSATAAVEAAGAVKMVVVVALMAKLVHT